MGEQDQPSGIIVGVAAADAVGQSQAGHSARVVVGVGVLTVVPVGDAIETIAQVIGRVSSNYLSGNGYQRSVSES